eukprot:g73262.t1
MYVGFTLNFPLDQSGTYLYDFLVNWGDNVTTVCKTFTCSHTYTTAGLYPVTVSGVLNGPAPPLKNWLGFREVMTHFATIKGRSLWEKLCQWWEKCVTFAVQNRKKPVQYVMSREK